MLVCTIGGLLESPVFDTLQRARSASFERKLNRCNKGIEHTSAAVSTASHFFCLFDRAEGLCH